MMKNKLFKALAPVAPIALGLSPFFASAAEIDLGTFNSGVASGTQAAVSMAGTFGTYGVVIAVAIIGAGVVVWLVVHGARRAKKALSGRF